MQVRHLALQEGERRRLTLLRQRLEEGGEGGEGESLGRKGGRAIQSLLRFRQLKSVLISAAQLER